MIPLQSSLAWKNRGFEVFQDLVAGRHQDQDDAGGEDDAEDQRDGHRDHELGLQAALEELWLGMAVPNEASSRFRPRGGAVGSMKRRLGVVRWLKTVAETDTWVP